MIVPFCMWFSWLGVHTDWHTCVHVFSQCVIMFSVFSSFFLMTEYCLVTVVWVFCSGFYTVGFVNQDDAWMWPLLNYESATRECGCEKECEAYRVCQPLSCPEAHVFWVCHSKASHCFYDSPWRGMSRCSLHLWAGFNAGYKCWVHECGHESNRHTYPLGIIYLYCSSDRKATYRMRCCKCWACTFLIFPDQWWSVKNVLQLLKHP